MKANKRSKKNTTTLTFDESKRKDFLCGFRKRKTIRKEKAKEELQQQLLAEKKNIKKKKREEVAENLQKMFPVETKQEVSRKQLELEGHAICIVDLNVQNIEKT